VTAGLKEGKKTPREGFLTQPRIQIVVVDRRLKKSDWIVKKKMSGIGPHTLSGIT